MDYNHCFYHAWRTYVFKLKLILNFLLDSDSVKYTLEADPVIMAHFICGIIVIFLIVLQHIFGLIVKGLIESKEESKLINKLGSLKKIHKVIFLVIKYKINNLD